MAVRRVAAESFLTAPLGAYVTWPGFLYGCAEPDLFVSLVGARPVPEDAEALVGLWQGVLVHARLHAPHPSLFDASRLAAYDAETFDVIRRFLVARRDEQGRAVRRQAVVHPEGHLGATVAGYYAVFPPAHEVRLFVERAAALAWLGRAAAEPSIAAAEAAWRAAAGPVEEVRRHLDDDPRFALDTLARLMAVSARALQRQLQAEGTSFRAERTAAQVRRAKRLLADPDRKLLDIALDVGCASHQVFSDMFRRETGVPPSEWRARRRRRRAGQARRTIEADLGVEGK